MNAKHASAGQRHGSFRISAAVFDRLDVRAGDLGVPRNQLIERYIDEGIRRDRHPMIYLRDGTAGRRAAIVGTRLDVHQVIDAVREAKGSTEAAAAYFECAPAAVAAAVTYYGEFKDEVDAFAERVRRDADAAEAAWHRERDALGV